MNKNFKRGEGLISNILAVAGFIILIAIIVWGAFHFLNLASSSFSSLFFRASDTIQISLPGKTAQSGQPLAISWKFSPPGNGTYAFLYQCKENFQFKISGGGNTMNVIPCGAAYTIAPASVKTTQVTPVLAAGSSLDVPFSIIYMQAGTSTSSHPQGSATMTVIAGPSQGGTVRANSSPTMTSNANPNVGAQPVPTPTYGAAQKKSSGPADLSVKILAVGVVEQSTGMFAARSPMYQSDIAAVQFDIANVGGSATGPWYFAAQLPTMPTTPYTSPQQRSLNPGDHILNTLRFDHVAPYGGTFSVTVDPSNSVRESNESNNYASQWVNGGYNQTYPQPQPYPYPMMYGEQYPYQY